MDLQILILPLFSQSHSLSPLFMSSTGEFQDIVVCEDNHLQLHCPENSVLAIESAMFGRTKEGTMECPSYTMQEVGKSVCLSVLSCLDKGW